jgi:hypothetical protein
METENIGFEEFEAAFEDASDNQISTEKETVEETTEPEDDSADAEKNDAEPEEKEPEDAPEKAEEKPAEETFTLKVNKEEKTYSREEVITLAQKGADYDRVKEQLIKANGQIEQNQEAMEVLADLAKESDMDIPKLLDTLRLNMLKKQGLSDDAANERLLRLKAEKENATLKAASAQTQQQESNADRAKREVSEFRENYPEVELTKELMDKLMPDVRGGKSLTAAYRNMEKAEADAKIAELERQLAAQKKNAENRSASPGSQKDSGGRRTKSEYDDFMEAFS